MNQSGGPLISVLIPVYNTIDYIEKCILSVLNQTYERFELILVDDGSTDGSGNVCDAYAQKDSRIRVIHKENQGLSCARNDALKIANGDLISWLDSDDFFVPEHLEVLLNSMEQTGSDAVISNFCNVNEKGERKNRYAFPFSETVFEKKEILELILTNTISPVVWACLMKKELYEGILFPDGKCFEDVSTTYKLFERANQTAYVNDVLLIRTIRSESIVHKVNLTVRMQGCFAYINRYSDAVKRWPGFSQNILLANLKNLRTLRKVVVLDSAANYRANREGMREILAFYRANFHAALSGKGGFREKTELRLMLLDGRTGFILSQAFVTLLGRKKGFLADLPIELSFLENRE